MLDDLDKAPGLFERIPQCAANDLELLYFSRNASWPGWIECKFASIRYLTLEGSDYPSRTAQEAAIVGHIQ